MSYSVYPEEDGTADFDPDITGGETRSRSTKLYFFVDRDKSALVRVFACRKRTIVNYIDTPEPVLGLLEISDAFPRLYLLVCESNIYCMMCECKNKSRNPLFSLVEERKYTTYFSAQEVGWAYLQNRCVVFRPCEVGEYKVFINYGAGGSPRPVKHAKALTDGALHTNEYFVEADLENMRIIALHKVGASTFVDIEGETSSEEKVYLRISFYQVFVGNALKMEVHSYKCSDRAMVQALQDERVRPICISGKKAPKYDRPYPRVGPKPCATRAKSARK